MKSLLFALFAIPCMAIAQQNTLEKSRFNTNYEEPDSWKEAEVADLPAFPKPENLSTIYVSPVATNNYLIDGSTLSIGSDNVVRYVLVVQTSGGAQNISFEGMHCKEGKWKTYATGRSDGTWSKARISEWRYIENKPVNRHHAALAKDFFCPNGLNILTADEGRNALRLGKHPNVN